MCHVDLSFGPLVRTFRRNFEGCLALVGISSTSAHRSVVAHSAGRGPTIKLLWTGRPRLGVRRTRGRTQLDLQGIQICRCGAGLAELGQESAADTSSKSAQGWLSSSRIRPTPAQAWSDFPQIWPTPIQLWQKLVQLWLRLPPLVDFASTSRQIWPRSPKCGRHAPKQVQDISKRAPSSGSSLFDSGLCEARSGDPILGIFRPPTGSPTEPPPETCYTSGVGGLQGLWGDCRTSLSG